MNLLFALCLFSFSLLSSESSGSLLLCFLSILLVWGLRHVLKPSLKVSSSYTCCKHQKEKSLLSLGKVYRPFINIYNVRMPLHCYSKAITSSVTVPCIYVQQTLTGLKSLRLFIRWWRWLHITERSCTLRKKITQCTFTGTHLLKFP